LELFGKDRRVDVPKLDVQGDEATIEIGRDAVATTEMEEAAEEPMLPLPIANNPEPPQPRKVKFPVTLW